MPSKKTARKTRTVSIAELAEELEMTPRKLRRITRSLDLGVGRGKRYALNAADIKKVRAAINK